MTRFNQSGREEFITKELLDEVMSSDHLGAKAFKTMKDEVKVRGELEIDLIHADSGELHDRVIVDNLVVTIGRRIMRSMLAGLAGGPVIISTPGGPVTITAMSEIYITRMNWGIAGHDPGTPTQPLPGTPDPSDDDLYTVLPVAPGHSGKAVVTSYPTTESIRFTASLLTTEANGYGISEEGLWTDEVPHDLMFAHTTFGLLTKSASFTFEFRHTILF